MKLSTCRVRATEPKNWDRGTQIIATKIRLKLGSTRTALCIMLGCLCISGCVAATTPAKNQTVKVMPIGTKAEATSASMAHAELQEDVMRFADRYGMRMTLVANRLLQAADTADERWLGIGWKLSSRVSAVSIAVGPDPVTNLLDMMVLASLTRLQVESYWVPEVIGKKKGQDLLKAVRILEEDIFTIADNVLTSQQQDDLIVLVQQWHEMHPDQHYFWDMRFGAFAGQRAARLARIAERGGLLGQITQTREAIDEARDLGERLLYYMQNAAALTRLQVQFGAYEMLRQPEMKRIFGSADRFNDSVERFAVVAETLPMTRLEAINQFMDQLTLQREGLLDDLLSEEARVRAVLADLQHTIVLGNELAVTVNSTVQTVDQLANKLGRGADAEDTQQFDIEDYHQLVVDIQKTAQEFTQFMQYLDELMSTEAWGEQRPQVLRMVYKIDAEIDSLVIRIFVFAALLIVLFFVLLFVYRYAVVCVVRRSKSTQSV